MSDNLNAAANVPGALKADLVAKAALFGAVGWIAFAVTAFALIGQNIVMAVMPKQVMASENGKVVGQVIFDEAKIRADDEIIGDVKTWVARCTSVNKISIYEDLAICLNHMESNLADLRLKQYEKNNYAVTIEKLGCDRPTVEFDNEQTQVSRKDSMSYELAANVTGRVICAIPGDKPAVQSFAVDMMARLTNKSTARPLGFEVTSFKDIEK